MHDRLSAPAVLPRARDSWVDGRHSLQARIARVNVWFNVSLKGSVMRGSLRRLVIPTAAEATIIKVSSAGNPF